MSVMNQRPEKEVFEEVALLKSIAPSLNPCTTMTGAQKIIPHLPVRVCRKSSGK